MHHFFRFLLIILAGSAVCAKAHGDSLTLNWDASTSPEVAGYNVYYGTSIWQSEVATSDILMQFTDPDAGAFAARFYRLVMH